MQLLILLGTPVAAWFGYREFPYSYLVGAAVWWSVVCIWLHTGYFSPQSTLLGRLKNFFVTIFSPMILFVMIPTLITYSIVYFAVLKIF